MQDLLRLRAAYIALCQTFEPNTFVTLATNQFWSLEKMISLVGSFAARMDDLALGHTWSAASPSARANGLFFIEHVGSNIHAHGLVRFPYGNEWGRAITAQRVWMKLCPSGSVRTEPLYDVEGAAAYCTKEMMSPRFVDTQIVMLEQFMSAKTLAGRTT